MNGSSPLPSLALLCALLTGFQTEAAPDRDLSNADLQALAQALGCPAKGASPMLTAALLPGQLFSCAALTRFARGNVPSPVGERRSFLGATFVVATGRVQGTFLLLDDTGALFDDITPDNPREAAELQKAIEHIQAGKPVPASNPVQQFVSSIPGMPGMKTRPGRTVGSSRLVVMKNRLFIRQDGDTYIILEVGQSTLKLGYVGVHPRTPERR
jgi:hypothetical protein